MMILYKYLLIAVIFIVIGYIVTLIYYNQKQKREHEEKMKELSNEWSSEEAKELLTLIKDIYN